MLSSYWCAGKLASTLLWYRKTGQYGIKGGSKHMCISVVVLEGREGAEEWRESPQDQAEGGGRWCCSTRIGVAAPNPTAQAGVVQWLLILSE